MLKTKKVKDDSYFGIRFSTVYYVAEADLYITGAPNYGNPLGHNTTVQDWIAVKDKRLAFHASKGGIVINSQVEFVHNTKRDLLYLIESELDTIMENEAQERKEAVLTLLVADSKEAVNG